MRKYLLIVYVLIMTPFIGVFSQEAGKLIVEINSLRNSEGQVFVSLHNGSEGFPGGEESMVMGAVVEIENEKSVASFEDLPLGEYAISVFHDENKNGEIDTNWIGIPKEGVGASNNAKGRMGPPKYEDAKFQFTSDGQKIHLDMDYF